VRLDAALGGSPRLWVYMQAAYDLWHAEKRTDLSDIHSLVA
jgi:plasmid maintenance system antidote protein VapI